jgi:hypothetical protein
MSGSASQAMKWAPMTTYLGLKTPVFKAEIWSSGRPGNRAMARGDSGKIYVGTRGIGRVFEITDNGKERTSRVVVDKLNQPAVAMHNGALYVMAIDKALRYQCGRSKNPSATAVKWNSARLTVLRSRPATI